MLDDTYGHSPLKNMFELRDVYGIIYSEERAARKKVRLGFIGGGGVAQSKHLPAILRLRTIWEPVEVAAVADPNEQQGKKVAALYGCQWYRDFRQMLKEEKLDGIEVLSPAHFHYEHALASMERELPVLVEKPLTRSLQQSEELCRYAEAKNLPLMTVANKRWSPPYRRAKGIVSESRFGNPVLWAGKFNLGYEYVDLLEEGTIHLLDLARYFMGDVVAVSAMEARNSKRSPSSVENVIISLRFQSGAIGSLHTSKTALCLKPWERVEIYGIGRWLAVEDQRDLLFYSSEEGPAQSWSPAVPNTLLFDEEFGGYMGEIENFLQVIRGEEKPRVTGWDGHRAYELVLATYLSLQTGEMVKLPLDPAVEKELVLPS
jgi:predicted dehydrogenase